MFKNKLDIENRHKRFIKTVCATEIVYCLKNSEGFATSSSVHYEDENGVPIGMICFWAEKALAISCIEYSWSDYKIAELTLNDFIENWCIGMESDGLLVATEFDRQMFGLETQPLDLILELISELKRINKNIDLIKYKSISDLENQIKILIQ